MVINTWLFSPKFWFKLPTGLITTWKTKILTKIALNYLPSPNEIFLSIVEKVDFVALSITHYLFCNVLFLIKMNTRDERCMLCVFRHFYRIREEMLKPILNDFKQKYQSCFF